MRATETGPAPLDYPFYNRPVVTVARELVGCVLRHQLADGVTLAGRIVETEAYRHDDPASHSFRGQTERNRSMFGPPGHAYVYLIYGVHTCFNVVCGQPGIPDAILIRALEPSEGVNEMWKNRFGSAGQPPEVGAREWTALASGPGKLCQALRIKKEEIDGTSLMSGPLVVLPPSAPAGRIIASARVGISRAVGNLWRFYEEGNAHVSRPRSATVKQSGSVD